MKTTYVLFLLPSLLLTQLNNFSFGDTIVYSNFSTYTGKVINGGLEVQGANQITRMIFDDIDPINIEPALIKNFIFSVSAIPGTSYRPHFLFCHPDGPGGGPGTVFWQYSWDDGFGYSDIHRRGYEQLLVYFPDPSYAFVLPPTKFWAGISFDNLNGTLNSRLDLIGLPRFDGPPSAGSSADEMFMTTSAGSFPGGFPAGSQFNFGGSPLANAGWRFTVIPEPASSGLLCIGLFCVGLIRRQRS